MVSHLSGIAWVYVNALIVLFLAAAVLIGYAWAYFGWKKPHPYLQHPAIALTYSGWICMVLAIISAFSILSIDKTFADSIAILYSVSIVLLWLILLVVFYKRIQKSIAKQ
jgi:membrane associated rhomboid family serine protease